MNDQLRRRISAAALEAASSRVADLDRAVERGEREFRRRLALVLGCVGAAIVILVGTVTTVAVAHTAGRTSQQVHVTALNVFPDVLRLQIGTRHELTATARYDDGSSARLATGVSWRSEDPGTAQIDASGRLYAVAAGTTTITATYQQVHDTARVTVVATRTLEALRIEPNPVSLGVNASRRLHAVGVFSDGSHENLTHSVEWGSADPSVATVQVGLLVGRRQGTTTVTASTPGFTASAAVTVVASRTLTSLTADPNPITLGAGDSARVTVLGSYSDGSQANLTTAVSWSSADPAVATVSAGLVTAEGDGTTTLTVMLDGRQLSIPVTVTASLTMITVEPGSSKTTVGQQPITLRAVATYDDGTTADVTDQAIWVSSDESVVTVSGGTVTAQGEGTATVTASMDGVTGQATVTVEHIEG